MLSVAQFQNPRCPLHCPRATNQWGKLGKGTVDVYRRNKGSLEKMRSRMFSFLVGEWANGAGLSC